MKIMSSATGYSGDPITLIAMLDPATGVLAIVKRSEEFREEPQPGFAFVTNVRCEAYDCLFQEEHWDDAIRAYKQAEGNEMVAFDDEVARYTPRIEVDGIDEKGQQYRLHPDLQNGEVAVLGLVHFQQRQRGILTAEEAMDEWFDLIRI
ncbi:hypothetical protein ACNFBR_27215 [Pseudomonas sp. NY11955]|uniref:hypothetical protein n=1 Tax=Pseudomonas sp. NY11955 TaxID=3400363 RepID=UPI003A84974B